MRNFLKQAALTTGAADVALSALARVERAANANVCDSFDGDMSGLDGLDGDFDVVGYTTEGMPIVGKHHKHHKHHGHGQKHLPAGVKAPPWWKGTAGVNQPNEMLHVLPLQSDTNNGVFTSALTAATFTYSTRPQKPFRGERIIASVAYFGPSAVAQAQSTAIFVGVDLQQVQAGNVPLSTWAATAFGVRLAMTDAEPGILISMPVVLVGAALLTTDTITVSIVLLGRVLA